MPAMTGNSSSTDRVRQYRQRQRNANRKLVRFYLDAESATKLDQLAIGQPHAALAEALLTTAITHAWAAREAQQRDREEREGRSQAAPQPAAKADSARSAHFLGRRRSIAGLDDATGKPGS
jgi:hypothetical protein